mgnify:FL=1
MEAIYLLIVLALIVWLVFWSFVTKRHKGSPLWSPFMIRDTADYHKQHGDKWPF